MATIKIHCGCGQHYTFDVGDGAQSSPVTCPACGARSTDAANTIILPSAQPKPVVRLHVSTPAPALPAEAPTGNSGSIRSRAALRDGPANPAQSEIEARAKIIWGDPPEEIVKFLMIQGFKHDESVKMVEVMLKERAATLRGIGIRKILTGIPTMLVAVVVFIKFIPLAMNILFVILLAVPVMGALWGAWMVLKGGFMLLFPSWEKGDIADM
jgi:hypothetical protein